MTEEAKTDAVEFYKSLCAAQSAMAKPAKDANNPHFKSKYATLDSVRDACVPELNKRGIFYYSVVIDDQCKTILTDGEQSISCAIPIIASKSDAQGYGSGLTYARRQGLLAICGLAPADDDGNDAVAAPPKAIQAPPPEEPTPAVHVAAIQAKFKGIKDVDALNKAKAYLKSDKVANIPDDMMKALWLGIMDVEENLSKGSDND